MRESQFNRLVWSSCFLYLQTIGRGAGEPVLSTTLHTLPSRLNAVFLPLSVRRIRPKPTQQIIVIVDIVLDLVGLIGEKRHAFARLANVPRWIGKYNSPKY